MNYSRMFSSSELGLPCTNFFTSSRSESSLIDFNGLYSMILRASDHWWSTLWQSNVHSVIKLWSNMKNELRGSVSTILCVWVFSNKQIQGPAHESLFMSRTLNMLWETTLWETTLCKDVLENAPIMIWVIINVQIKVTSKYNGIVRFYP